MKIEELINRAYSEIGVTEFPANSNNVRYNTWMYGKEVNGASYPWCAAFVSWLFKDTKLCKKTASCLDMLSYFEKNGQIVKKPQAGDIVFFRYSTNARRTNHVGIVVAVQGSQITTIEGNTSLNSNDNGGAVMMRKRTSSIVAYARPCYEDAWITIKKGSKGVFVEKLQRLLNAKIGSHLVIDGDMGNLSCIELVKMQALYGLEKDAVAGAKTWEALLR